MFVTLKLYAGYEILFMKLNFAKFSRQIIYYIFLLSFSIFKKQLNLTKLCKYIYLFFIYNNGNKCYFLQVCK